MISDAFAYACYACGEKLISLGKKEFKRICKGIKCIDSRNLFKRFFVKDSSNCYVLTADSPTKFELSKILRDWDIDNEQLNTIKKINDVKLD